MNKIFFTVFKNDVSCRMLVQDEAVYIDYQSSFDEDSLGKKDCFTEHKPLVIEVLKGKRIKLTMVELGPSNDGDLKNTYSKKICTGKLGHIFDGKKPSSNATVCSNAFDVHIETTRKDKISSVYESVENRLNLYFSSYRKSSDVLIKVEGMFLKTRRPY